MLGGFGHTSDLDVRDSRALLLKTGGAPALWAWCTLWVTGSCASIGGWVQVRMPRLPHVAYGVGAARTNIPLCIDAQAPARFYLPSRCSIRRRARYTPLQQQRAPLHTDCLDGVQPSGQLPA